MGSAPLFGYADSDRRRPLRDKLGAALALFVRRRGVAPACALVNPADADELARDPRAPAIPLRPSRHVPRSTFYLGAEE